MMQELDTAFRAILLPLGTNAGLITAPNQEPISYLLKLINNSRDNKESEESQILMDSGSKYVLDENFIDHNKLDAIFLSHGHLDHTFYFGRLLRKLKKKNRKRDLLLFCQDQTWRVMKWNIRLHCGSIPSFLKHIPLGIEMDKPYLKSYNKQSKTDYTQVNSLDPIILENKLRMDISIAPTMHSHGSIAYRIKISNKTEFKSNHDIFQLDIIFSPDTSYISSHLIEFARNAKYWMLDSGFTKEEIDKRYEMFINKKKGGEIVCHSSPYYSGMLCEAAKVDSFIVIHYVWNRFADNYKDFEKEIKSRIKQTYKGNIIISFDLQPIVLELSKIEK